jgi:hypothetical protein
MSASWDHQDASWYLSWPAGDFAGTGAYTMAVLMEPDSNNCRMSDWFASATEKGQFLLDTGALFGKDDFTSGVATGYTGSTGWVLVAITKAAGSTTYRMHYWTYASDGSGTMNHAVAGSPANHADESPVATTVRLGWSSGGSHDGMIAVGAFWDRALSDGELDSLKSNQLDAWNDLEPDLGIELSGWNGTSGDVVFRGSSGAATLSGTIGSGANPSSFNFTLTPAQTNTRWLEAIDSLRPPAHWRLGDPATTMRDRTVNARNGTHTGVTNNVVGSVADDSDEAITYAGTSGSHSDFAYQAWMNPMVEAYTLMCAVKYTDSGVGPFMFFSRTGGANFNQGLFFQSGNLGFNVRTTSGSSSVLSANDFNDGNWHLVVGTWTPANGIRIYVDSVLEGTSAWGGTLSTAQNDFQMGGRGSGNFAPCSVDEAVPLPGVELTQAQIDYLFLAWGGNVPDPTASFVELEHGSGASLLLEQDPSLSLMTEAV